MCRLMACAPSPPPKKKKKNLGHGSPMDVLYCLHIIGPDRIKILAQPMIGLFISFSI